MDNQGTRDDLGGTGRSKPIGTYAGAATPTDATAVGEPIETMPGGQTDFDRPTAGASGKTLGAEAGAGSTSVEGTGSGGAMAKVDAGLEMAAGGIDKLVDVIRDRGEGLGQSSGTAGTVGSVATAAADRLEGASQYLHQTDADRLLADLEALVRRRPAESLLVAAGLGFLFAKALR